MKNVMTRGRSQIIWRYTPNSTFRYNDDGAWCIVTDITETKKQDLDGLLQEALVNILNYWNAIGITSYPDPCKYPNKYCVVEPYWIEYVLWPTVFMCRKCHRIQWYQSVDNLKQKNDNLRCYSCGSENGLLRQTPFAFVCECGQIDTIFVPKCPNNPKHPIALKDNRSFAESYWYCKTCNIPIRRRSNDGLGIRQCTCGKLKRGISLIDPKVYYSQTLSLVNINPDILKKWQENVNFSYLLLGAILNINTFSRDDIYNLSTYETHDSVSPEVTEIKKMLLDQGMPVEQVAEIIEQSINKTRSTPWNAYKNELSCCKGILNNFDPSNYRQSIEYVFVKEEIGTFGLSIEQLKEEAKESNDTDTLQQMVKYENLASKLGFINLKVIQDLPILLAGIGYSRYFASPIDFDGTSTEVKLRPYKTDENGKIPIYIAKNSTESLFYELDSWRLGAFLECNGIINIPKTKICSEVLMKSWLISISHPLVVNGESHLNLLPFEVAKGFEVDLPSAFLFGVLHTISHVLKLTAHQYVGIDNDALAEYLFPLHSSGLLYASNHVSFTLGGIDAVFRSNLEQWLGTAFDFAEDCSFDPVCKQSGGACLTCLYTKFGCNYFNRTLSRSFLFGGRIKGYDEKILGFWSPEVIQASDNLKNSCIN